MIMDDIEINSYLSFDPEYGRFKLTNEASEILYRKKQVICSYSGCDDWCHNFFCELIDLYSGSSQYNYSLGSVVHKVQIDKMYAAGHKEEVINWIKRHKDDRWFVKAATMLANIIEDVPENI